MKCLFAFTVGLIGLVTASLRAELPAIVINEVMAINTRAYPDITDFEDYPDWIELKNNTDSLVNLAGYFLSDDTSDPFKWPIPSGATIPANGFLLIMADGYDTKPGNSFPRGYWPWKDFVTEKYHANFNLASTGEHLTLSHSTGLSSITLVEASSPVPVAPATVAVWKYKDDGSDQSTQWRARNFDDQSWNFGPSELGYEDSPATVVSYGASANNKHITTYFRHHFSVANPSIYQSLTLKLLVDDGCVIYLNGTEVVRRNMPAGEVNYRTLTVNRVGGTDESNFFTYNLSASGLVTGDNVLSVEVHQESAGSSDLSFDLGLTASSHTGFTITDSIRYTQQVPDVSYGRDASNPEIWQQFVESTPSIENSQSTANDIRKVTDAVTVSLPGGFYAANQFVTLSSPSGVVHYTLDGSNPTSKSPVYSSPLLITSTTVLRTRCFERGKVPSSIVTCTYFCNETQTNIPYVSIVADPNTLFGNTIGIYANQHESVTGFYGLKDVYKGKDAPGNVEFFGPHGTSGFSAGCGIRIGGENNWVHPQKALNIAVRGKYGSDDISYDLFPGTQIPIHTSFTLRDGGDNWDKDMLRDGLYPKIAQGFLNVDTADYRPCIVFINSAYYGIHDLRQRWDEMWFFQQYHLPADQIDHLLYGHITSASTTLGVDKGTTTEWLELVNFLNTADLTRNTNWVYVESKIDMDSFMDFVIAESYGNNASWHHNREFWKAKRPGSKWRWFLTDMDRTFFTSNLSGVLSDMLSTEEVLKRLKTNISFKQRLAQRYAAHMAATFLPSRVQSIISKMDSEVSALVPRHVARWAPRGTTVTTRDSHIQQIKNYADQRASNIYGELNSQLGVGTAVEFTLDVSNPSHGRVHVQGVPVEPSSFKMFPNIPFTLKAVPAPGYSFSGWTGAEGGDSITVSVLNNKTVTATFVPSGGTVIGGVLQSDTTFSSMSSPYILNNDLTIPSGVTLVVEPGVRILMPDRINIRVQGILNINGTAAQPVIISGLNGGRWGGISFEAPQEPSHLGHLILRGATKGIDAIRYKAAVSGFNATVNMEFLEIIECDSPIYMYAGSCTLRDSRLYNPYTGDVVHVKKGVASIQRCIFLGNNAPDTDGIDFDGVTNGLIEDCRFYRFQGSNSDGIDIGEGASNLLIQGNQIYYNSDKGVSVGQGSKVTIRKNLIVGCNLGVGVKDYGSLAIIEQNTFVSCATGVAVYEKNFGLGGGSAIISDTIFSKATTFPVTADGLSSLSVSYSLSDSVPLPGTANLLADPLFVDPTVLNFELKTLSPAINAGDIAHPLDPDNTRMDIGAHYLFNPRDYPYTLGATIVINEILANSGSASDWIELHNRTASPVNIGGWFLSDSGTNLLKYRIPVGTTIDPGGYIVFDEAQNFGTTSIDPNKIIPFALSDVGETVYLSSAQNDQLTDYRNKEDFGPSTEGVTLGVHHKPSSDTFNFIAMAIPTPGTLNSAPKVGPIVISEIMFHPGGSGTGDAEYIELINLSHLPVTLYDTLKGKGWRLTDAIEFEFPSSSPLTMGPGERIVIVKNIVAFNLSFGALLPRTVKLFEWNTGSLNNGGETIQLDRPGAVDGLNIIQYVRQDRVNYSAGFPWPTTPDGKGPALNKVLEPIYGNDFINWMAGPATPGTPNIHLSPDTDKDGMPDAWESAFDLNRFAADADSDPDNDGFSNHVEFRNGTDPHIPDHAITLEVDLSSDEILTVRFQAVHDRSYTIQYSDSIGVVGWQTLEQIQPLATDQSVAVRDIDLGKTTRFYRVVSPALP